MDPYFINGYKMKQKIFRIMLKQFLKFLSFLAWSWPVWDTWVSIF